ncbi:MAG: hypothetical protein ABSG12_11770 [Steroidobacteraceae bacterium]
MRRRLLTWICAMLYAMQGTAALCAGGDVQQPGTAAGIPCRVDTVAYHGWQVRQVSNRWVRLLFVPENGGRLIQVIFDDHPFLFVNPKFAGKHLSPSASEWFNYGGDKVWVLPEGGQDERHWVVKSDALDDGTYTFQLVRQGERCEIRLSGPVDPQTGLQLQRTVSLGSDSPAIDFQAVMKNATGHPIEWSIQSVSQYDTSDAASAGQQNRTFWGFARANPASSYLDQYHVRTGPAENSAAQVRDDGNFAVHYVPLASELWVDSKEGWLAVVDGASRYAMVERFRYDGTRPYPGKASLIFYSNGPQLQQRADGSTTFEAIDQVRPDYYMEAELNSPVVRLEPGEEYRFDTRWYPTRADADFKNVTDAGVILEPLRAVREATGSKIVLTGSFGVLFPGKLVAHYYDAQGTALGAQSLIDVDPTTPVVLRSAVHDPGAAGRISLHLEAPSGLDQGALGEALVQSAIAER